MRILFCTNSLGAVGGIERVTIVKANALAEIPGNEVAICFTDKGTYPERTIHPISPKVKVYDLGVSFWDLCPLNLKNLLITAPKKFAGLRRALKKLIKDFKPDVAISTGSYEKFGLASLRIKDTVKIREYHFSSNYRDYIACSKYIKIAELIERFILGNLFDRNFLLTKEDLEDNFKGNKKYDYQHNPCTFDTVSPLSDDQKENVVVAVGRLEDQKNFLSLVRIWAKIADEHKDWKLKIAGDGTQYDLLKKEIEGLGLNDSVQLLGFCKDIKPLMQKAKILAMTSKYEGLPLTLLEAMAVGTVPITYTYKCGPRDIITDNVNGILVDFSDEEQFAERLSALINDPQRIRDLSQSATERAKDFEIKKIVDQLTEKYTALIAEKRRKK